MLSAGTYDAMGMPIMLNIMLNIIMSTIPKKSSIGSMERLSSMYCLIFPLSPDLYMACIWPHLDCISRTLSSTLFMPDCVACISTFVPNQLFFCLTDMYPRLSRSSNMVLSSSGDRFVIFRMRSNFVMPCRMVPSTIISFDAAGISGGILLSMQNVCWNH